MSLLSKCQELQAGNHIISVPIIQIYSKSFSFYLLTKTSLSSPIHRKNKGEQLISQRKKNGEKGYEQQQQTCIDQLTEKANK